MITANLAAPHTDISSKAGKLLLDAGWQATKVVWVCRTLAALGVIPLASAPSVLTSLADIHGQLEPLDARIALSSLLFGVGLLMTVGTWLYLNLYVTRLTHTQSHALVTFPGIFRSYTRSIPRSRLYGGAEHEGRMHIYSTGLRVEAPYRTVRIHGWWFPLILDQQGSHVDDVGIERLIRNGNKLARD